MQHREWYLVFGGLWPEAKVEDRKGPDGDELPVAPP